MLPYWALFGIVAFAAMMEQADFRRHRLTLPMTAFGVALALMIGLRHEVGGDYYQYLNIFENAGRLDLAKALERGDIGYQALNWTMAQLGGGLWTVNLVSGVVFAWGLLRLTRLQPSPWLAVLVAVPYLIVVVSMGYTRQAVAIGVVMAGLASLGRDGAVIRFALYVGIAALFHRTAVIILPLAIFAGQRNRLLNGLAIIAMSYALYDVLLSDDVDYFVENYLERRYDSQGALVRILMLVLPAIVMLYSGRRLGFSSYERRLWTMIAYVSLATLPVLFIMPSSTAVDRLALYLLPLQLVVLSRMPLILRPANLGRALMIGYSFTVLFVWLNFAVHARYWVPYQLYDFDGYEEKREAFQ